jgi:hypothetical protein
MNAQSDSAMRDTLTSGSTENLIFSNRNGTAGWTSMVEFAGQANIKNQSAVEMYGFGTIFRKLCLLPEWFPIKVDAQHGVSLWMIPPSHNLNAPERLVFVHSNRWVDIFRKHGRKGAVAVGSPFVSYRHYLLRRHGSAGTPPRGAIFYLSHSTFWEKASWESADLVRLLENIRSQEGSLTVCVHFVDVLNGLAKPIYDAGFDLATAGNYFNSEFPDNFYALLHGHRTIYTNAVGSHVFYAVEASKSILITGGTGSFGNTFVPMTLEKYNPKRLIIYSRDEMKQWEMAKKFQGDRGCASSSATCATASACTARWTAWITWSMPPPPRSSRPPNTTRSSASRPTSTAR